MLGSVILFRKDSFNNIVTITFSSLIVCEILNVFSEVYKVNYKMIISSIMTFVIYFMSIALLRSYFDVSYITWVFCCKVIGITLASWAPLHFFKRIYERKVVFVAVNEAEVQIGGGNGHPAERNKWSTE